MRLFANAGLPRTISRAMGAAQHLGTDSVEGAGANYILFLPRHAHFNTAPLLAMEHPVHRPRRPQSHTSLLGVGLGSFKICAIERRMPEASEFDVEFHR